MKIGFIGCGNMATAMLKGILKSGEVAATDMIASAKSDKTRKKIEQELGIQKADTNAQVVDFADVVFLAVKPQFLEGVLNEIKDSVKEKQIFISIAPGKTLQWLGEHLGEKTKVIRTMPNTPAMVGEGMTALCDRVSLMKIAAMMLNLEDLLHRKVDMVEASRLLPDRKSVV